MSLGLPRPSGKFLPQTREGQRPAVSRLADHGYTASREAMATSEELQAEINALRQRVAELERGALDHKHTEEALRESEGRARALLESASEAIVIVNREGQIVLVNAKTESIFGYAREELIGRTLEVLVPERLRASLVHHRLTYALDPRTRPMGEALDLTGRRKDGSELPIEISLSFAEAEGEPLFMAFVTDITQRKTAEQVLRRSQRRAEALLEAASEGIVIVNAAGHIVTLNRKAEQLFGYDRAELLGRDLEILLPTRFRTAHVHHRAHYFAEPRVRPMGRGLDLIALRKDGTEFPVEISLSFIDTEEGRQALGFVTDITERVALERATRQADRLMAAGRLAAGIAHEVNNPLGIITSRLEIMLIEAEETRLPPAVVEDLTVLHRHAMRVASIANRLLSFTRESPRDRAPVDLNAVVTETLSLFARDTTRTQLNVSCSLHPALPQILGHANALGQVVLNLLTNAVQAIHDTGTIRIKTEFARGRVHLEVADDGPGIPAEILPKIFEPFYTTRSSGTGLGLSVSYGIVHDHNGTIDVRSEPGQGATFRLSFPPAPESHLDLGPAAR